MAKVLPFSEASLPCAPPPELTALSRIAPMHGGISDQPRPRKGHIGAIAVMATLFPPPGLASFTDPPVSPGGQPAGRMPPPWQRTAGQPTENPSSARSPALLPAPPPPWRSPGRPPPQLGHRSGRGPRRTGPHRHAGQGEGRPAVPRRRGRHREVQRGEGEGGHRHPHRRRPDRRGRPPHRPPQHRPARPRFTGHRAVPQRHPGPGPATGALLRPRRLSATRLLPRPGGRPAERPAARHPAAGLPDHPRQGPRRPGDRTPRGPPRRAARTPHRDPRQAGRRPQAAGHPDRRRARRVRTRRRRPARRRPGPRRPLGRSRRSGPNHAAPAPPGPSPSRTARSGSRTSGARRARTPSTARA